MAKARLIAFNLLAAFLLISIFCHFSKFGNYSAPKDNDVLTASTGVLFIGGSERMGLALRLLEEGKLKRLYLSGDDGSAEYSIHTNSELHKEIMDVRRLYDCCVERSALATNTLQNARDVRCWIEREKIIGPVVLITTKVHMARSYYALSALANNVKIIPYASNNEPNERTFIGACREYVKYLLTILVMNFGLTENDSRLYGAYAQGCPGDSGVP